VDCESLAYGAEAVLPRDWTPGGGSSDRRGPTSYQVARKSVKPYGLLKPEERSAHHVIVDQAEAFRRDGLHDEGIRLLVGLLGTCRDDAAIHFCLGNLYFDKGDLNAAEGAYLDALAIQPGHAKALNNLAVVYKHQKRIQLFVRTYRKAQRAEMGRPTRARGRDSGPSRIFWRTPLLLLLMFAGLVAWLLLQPH
jgi:tetratricopeptide (TPR) repeat protein